MLHFVVSTDSIQYLSLSQSFLLFISFIWILSIQFISMMFSLCQLLLDPYPPRSIQLQDLPISPLLFSFFPSLDSNQVLKSTLQDRIHCNCNQLQKPSQWKALSSGNWRQRPYVCLAFKILKRKVMRTYILWWCWINIISIVSDKYHLGVIYL